MDKITQDEIQQYKTLQLKLANQIRKDWDSGIHIGNLAIMYNTTTYEIARLLCVSEGLEYIPDKYNR